MTTSAPADCACRESRIASAVLVAPVCAITGIRPATWSTTVSTTRRRSSLLSVLNSPVEPHATTPCTPPVMDRSTRARSDASSIVPSSVNGVASAVSTPRSCAVICCLLRGHSERGRLAAGGEGALAIGRQQAQDLLRGREPGLDGGLGVQRPEVVAGQEDPASPPHEGGLERIPAWEAVGGTGLPALDLRFDDGAAEAGAEDMVQVVGVDAEDLFIALRQQRARQAGGGEGHDAAARLPSRLAAPDEAGLVQHDVERPLWRSYGVRVVPGLRSCLVREECRAHIRAIPDLPQGLVDLLRDVHRDPVAHRGRGCQHDKASLDLVVRSGLPVPDDDGALLVDDLDDLGTELNAVAEGRGDALRQGGRATQDAPIQALADVPNQAEVADPRAGGYLVGVRGRTGDRRAEQRLRVLRQVADEVPEGAAVLEVVDPLLPAGRVLTGPLPRDGCVPQDLPADLDARLDQRDPRRQRHRDPERIRLDTPPEYELPVHRQACQRAGDLGRGDSRLVQESIGGRPRAGKDMAAPVEPVGAATFGPDAAAHPAAGL